MIDTYNKKISDYDKPLNLKADDPRSFINSFRKNYEYSIASIQSNLGFKATDCSVIEFMTFEKMLSDKASRIRATPKK